MQFSTLTLIFSSALAVAFLGTVNPDLRWGAIWLFILAFCAVIADGFVDYTKAKIKDPYNPSIAQFLGVLPMVGLLIVAVLTAIAIGV
jgi:hypothetical protein